VAWMIQQNRVTKFWQVMKTAVAPTLLEWPAKLPEWYQR